MALLRGLHAVFATVVMYTVHYPWTALCALLCLPFAVARAHAITSLVARIWAIGLFAMVLRRVRVSGREQIDPQRTYLLVLNHTSLYDIPALMTLFPRVAWLGREHLLRIPLFGFVLSRLDYIAIHPGDVVRSKAALDEAIGKAPRVSIAIFPEGTRTRDGRLGPFKKGFTYIVKDTDLDVLPISIHGLYRWRPKHQRTLRPLSPVQLEVHTPLANAALRSLAPAEMAERVRRVFVAALNEHEGAP